jgi:DUF4097 and DUF4098 domain-containing protein YvlB
MIRTLCKSAVFLLASWPLTALSEQAVSQSAPMSANGTLDVSNVSGEVTIRGWDRPEVQVKGEIGDEQKLEFSADGDRTRIEVHSERDPHNDDDADLDIRVPSTSRVRANTISANLHVTGMTGELELQSVSGDIDTEVFGADVTVQTISGSIEVAGHHQTAEMHLSVVSGDAWVRDIAGDLTARTISGDLNVRAGKLRRTRIDTTSGDVHVEAGLDPAARLEVDSTSGDLVLELCGKPDGDYELTSFSGDIQAYGRRGEPRNAHGPTSELRFKLGDGGALVRADSLSGEIMLDDCGHRQD